MAAALQQRRVDVDTALEWMCQERAPPPLCRDVVGIVFTYCVGDAVSRHAFRTAAAAAAAESEAEAAETAASVASSASSASAMTSLPNRKRRRQH